jgi:hypothetical protein
VLLQVNETFVRLKCDSAITSGHWRAKCGEVEGAVFCEEYKLWEAQNFQNNSLACDRFPEHIIRGILAAAVVSERWSFVCK